MSAGLILKATSVTDTVRWYAALGFTVRAVGEAWAEVGHGPTVLQFVSGTTPWDGAPGMTGSVYVPVPSVDDIAAALPYGVDAPWGVEARPWGARELVLRDPDGYFVTFTAG